MKILKPLFFSAVSRVRLTWLIKRSPLNLLIPYQHLVSDEPVPYIENLYAFKNVRQFEADVDYLLKNYSPVSLIEVIEHQKTGRPFYKKSFLLTFDDGLRQVYDTVMPLLLRKGVPAALFVNPAFIDNKEIFYDIKKGLILHKLRTAPIPRSLVKEIEKIFSIQLGSLNRLCTMVQSINYHNKYKADAVGNLLEIDFMDFAVRQQPFMTTGQIKTWINNGFHTGAHSLDHPLYSSISLQEQIRQTKESVDWVCRIFNLPYRTFAFPHVDTGVSHAFFTSVLQGRFPLDLILGNRTAMTEGRAKVLHRFIGENPSLPAETMVKAVLSFNMMKNAIGISTVKRSEL